GGAGVLGGAASAWRLDRRAQRPLRPRRPRGRRARMGHTRVAGASLARRGHRLPAAGAEWRVARRGPRPPGSGLSGNGAARRDAASPGDREAGLGKGVRPGGASGLTFGTSSLNPPATMRSLGAAAPEWALHGDTPFDSTPMMRG